MLRDAYDAVLAMLDKTSGERRADTCRTRLADHPRCAISRYVLACHEFDHGRPATAVRHMMVAHHAEPALASAALLVFAGLSQIETPERPLLDVLVRTWDEFRRPQFDQSARERRLLDCFARPAAELGRASPLAASLWRLPLETVRSQLRELSATSDAADAPLLLLPA